MHESPWQLGPPPGARPVRAPSAWGWLAALAALGGLAAASFLVPLPVFYAYLPGPVRDAHSLVTVRGAPTYSSEGELLLTTVSVDTSVTFAEWVASGVDPDKTVVLKDAVTGGASLDQLRRQQREEMRNSKLQAQVVALGALGLGRPDGDGARVTAVAADSPAGGVLEKGDVIVAIDGRPVATVCDVGRQIDSHEVGERVRVTVRRNERRQTFTIRLGENELQPGSPLLGVFMTSVAYRFDSDLDIEISTGRIAGPSAGLMISLAIYDALSPDDLTHGRAVAGTGEIQCDGDVTPIGGIEQKVAGAELEGADIFLTPLANVEAARRAADDIEIVPVGDFDDAVEYLESLG